MTVGLHARPSVKFTKLAKSFPAEVGVALARRPVVRRQEHRQGHGREGAEGHDASPAGGAATALKRRSRRWSGLVERDFDEAIEGEAHVRTA